MTGHDLDLDAIRSVSENGNVRANRDQVRALCAEVERLTHIDWQQRQDWLVASTKEISAKLAAAEQERDTAKSNAVAALRLLEVNRAALAAVREAARPLMKWVEFHMANYSGNPPNRRLAISYEAAPVTFADVQAFVAALAAAEQDEPKREQS